MNTGAALPGTDAVTIADGTALWIRPIRAGDAPGLQRGFRRLTGEQIRQRAFRRMSELSSDDARRLAAVDPRTGAAFVAVDADGEIRGEARLYEDASHFGAEFALVVDPALAGKGLGTALMQRLLTEARGRGLQVLWGDVLLDNWRMLEFVRGLGASRRNLVDDPGVARVAFNLRAHA